MNASIALPANAYLHFAQAYGFEGSTYDGGVLEYSSNGGASWSDAGGLFDYNGYKGTIASGYGNPLAGRSAFVADSHGYISSRLNLASLAGQNVRFRWRMGLDSSGYDWGWWLDDVRIYTCALANTPTPTSTPTPTDTPTSTPTPTDTPTSTPTPTDTPTSTPTPTDTPTNTPTSTPTPTETPTSIPLAAPAISAGRDVGGVELRWTQTQEGIVRYEVYRSTGPYFMPDSGSLLDGNVLAPEVGNQATFPDPFGAPRVNYYYRVLAVGAGEAKSPASNRVGAFHFDLTPGAQ
jgi:hypothetical protein